MELEEILKEKILYIQLYDGYSLIKHEELNKTCKMMDNLVCKIKELEEELKLSKLSVRGAEEETEKAKERIKELEFNLRGNPLALAGG